MTVTAAWYNEPDPFKAAVIREAIKAGAIADGVVDERSIKDVRASDLVEYTQCHFFAGGGFWSLALRRAGWPDDRHVWTGSCPCPSFSAAGKGGGFDDPRHLWPDWEKLIRECRPPVVFGEQADDSIGYGWLDLVQTDLEAQAYAVGKVVLGTCSVGGADIRQRLYFVADTNGEPGERRTGSISGTKAESNAQRLAVDGSLPIRHQHGSQISLLGDTPNRGCGIVGDAGEPGSSGHADSPEQPGGMEHADMSGSARFGTDGRQSAPEGRLRPGYSDSGESRGMADADGRQPRYGEIQRSGEHGQQPEDGGSGGLADAHDGRCEAGRLDRPGIDRSDSGGNSAPAEQSKTPELRAVGGTGPLKGFWRDCDWIHCRPERGYPNGRWRPVEGGTFPLAHGDPCRLGRLRLYGDAINIEVATAWIKAYLESVGK